MYIAIRSISAAERPSTYAVDPTSPDSSPPHHAKRSVFCGLDVREHQRRLEQCRRAGAVVVDPGACRDGVEMTSGHDDVVVVHPVELGDHVRLRIVHDRDGRGRAGLGEHLTGGEAHADHRDGDRREGRARRRHRRDVREGAAAVGRRDGGVPLVEQDHCRRARGLCIRDLEGEAAATPLHQCDPAGDEAREVAGTAGRRSGERRPDRGFRERSLAPARRVRAIGGSELDVDGRHLVRSPSPAALPVTPPDRVRDGRRRVLLDRLRDLEVEQVDARRPSRRPRAS